MVGYDVSKYVVDSKAADAVLSLRSSFDKVETLAKWLANQPVVDGADPLITQFGYTVDEAYLLRFVFESFETLRTTNSSLFETARKFTGLE